MERELTNEIAYFAMQRERGERYEEAVRLGALPKDQSAASYLEYAETALREAEGSLDRLAGQLDDRTQDEFNRSLLYLSRGIADEKFRLRDKEAAS